MRWLWAALAASVIVACSDDKSRLDDLAASDPWAAPPTGMRARSSDDDGFGELKQMLAKLAEGVQRPGPYEAPDKSTDYDAARPHWGVLAIGGDIVEREAFSWQGGGTELGAAIARLRELAADAQLTGVLLRVGALQISLPDAVELRAAMRELRAAGKRIACHTEDASNATYLVLAACDTIGLAPLGGLAITGPAAMPIHVKPLLDKLGVQADFLHVGAYKGAAEPLTRDAPSKEMTETLGAILDRHYETMVEVIAADRKLAPAAVKALIDTALFTPMAALEARLVDVVVPFEAFRDSVAQAPWTRLRLAGDEPSSAFAAGLKLARFIGAVPPEKPESDHVALVYALGAIIDGNGDGVLGARHEIASRTLVAALRALAVDDSVKAVVLRIDSGGGSAQASELIWHALTALKAKKPVVVSMSDVAASGGYYIAVPATKIFAHPDTLTGSIGVVGGKLAPSGALDKLGVRAFPMGRGKRATMMASFAPWSADERAAIQRSMEDVYRVFVQRVAAGRKKSVGEIEKLAQGRVWTGATAKSLGLVDELGGLDAAIAEAARLGKVAATTALEVYPPAPTLRDLLHGWEGVADVSAAARALGAPHDAALAALAAADPRLADATRSLVELVLSFRATTIQAIAVLPVIR